MKRRTRSNAPAAIIGNNVSPDMANLTRVVARLHQDETYREVALKEYGPEAIRLALTMWGGRSLRDLARATGLSPTYLSLVATGKQRISLAALQHVLCECPGVIEKAEQTKNSRKPIPIS